MRESKGRKGDESKVVVKCDESEGRGVIIGSSEGERCNEG